MRQETLQEPPVVGGVGACRRRRRGAREAAEEAGELFELGGGEVREEQALDAGDVCAAGLRELRVAGLGQPRVGDARVARAGDALDQLLRRPARRPAG